MRASARIPTFFTVWLSINAITDRHNVMPINGEYYSILEVGLFLQLEQEIVYRSINRAYDNPPRYRLIFLW